jgi:hypothetical protein
MRPPNRAAARDRKRRAEVVGGGAPNCHDETGPSADGMHSGERVKEARQSTHPVDLTVPTLS